jgi:pantetheine-phosphate adenylyltransferase
VKIAVCPGSFDPITYGHIDIISRTADIFDLVYVVVLTNPRKESLFTVEERLEMLHHVLSQFDNVRCEHYGGLVIEYARLRKAVAIVRGLRAVTDFEFEFKMASMNRHLDPEVETMFMMTSNDYSFLSSSAVKEIASFGGDVSQWVPKGVAQRLTEKFAQLKS